ncbi:hypothetical protein BN130_3141 [Cronobacter malonaticus 507]|nr:hypothetical protein BN130_3141 [Cronobacter malonaticus 507]
MFLGQLFKIAAILNLLQQIQCQFFFFNKDMQCCCCFCHDRALSGVDNAGYTTTRFSPFVLSYLLWGAAFSSDFH